MAKEINIREIEVIDAEEVVKVKVLEDKGEEYFYLNHLPDDERGRIIKQVVEDAMKDYVDPTEGMTEAEMIQFDKEVKEAIKTYYDD